MPATRNRRKLAKAAETVPYWWHSIDLGDEVVTAGHRSPEFLAEQWRSLELPDLRGKTVLDVGAWDGYFSFEAERAGASRIVALDHYAWSLDLDLREQYAEDCREAGTAPRPYHLVKELWKPDELPGKAGFDTAHRARESRVESLVGDFMTMDLSRVGTFDVVLFLGVLAHMRHPLLALERVARLAKEVLVVETEAVALPGYDHHGFLEFFEADELDGDPTTWWAPNRKAVTSMLRAAGCSRVEGRNDARARPPTRDALHRYRLVLRGWQKA